MSGLESMSDDEYDSGFDIGADDAKNDAESKNSIGPRYTAKKDRETKSQYVLGYLVGYLTTMAMIKRDALWESKKEKYGGKLKRKYNKKSKRENHGS